MSVYPRTPDAWKIIEHKPNVAARERAIRTFELLDKLDPIKHKAKRNEAGGVPYFQFDERAQRTFNEWRARLERRLRSGELELAAFESHLAKYRSLVPSLALIFYAIGLASAEESRPAIAEEYLEKAIRWAEFLEAHARRIYGIALNRGLHAAHALVRKIEKGAVRDGAELRWIYRRGWTLLSSSDLECALAVLLDAGWIRTEEIRGRGRPSEILRLHPELRQCREVPDHPGASPPAQPEGEVEEHFGEEGLE
jgi:hypothetical protein